MKTFNRIYTVIARLKLRRKNYYRRMSFIALISMLLVSFQNCSQGKFEIDEAQYNASSKSNSSGNDSLSNDDGSMPPPPPPAIEADPAAPTGPVGPTQAQISAEIARKNRCKSAIKMPVITNANDFANKVLEVKSGLALDAGDLNLSNNPRPIAITIDDSQGIDSARYSVADNCSFRTSVIEEVSNDAGKQPVFEFGIDNAGNAVTVADQNGQRAGDRMAAVLQRNTSGNNNNGLAFTMGTPTMGINYMIRQTVQTQMRTIRCAQGSIYYRYRVQVETQGLNNNNPPFTTGTNVTDASMTTGWIYARVNVTNSCWQEYNLTKLTGASAPAANSLLGTAAVADGEWAVSVSLLEGGSGYIYIFRKVANVWTFFQKLKAPNGAGTPLSGLALKNGLLVVSSGGDGLYRVTPPRPGYPGQVYVYNLSGSQLANPIQTINNPLALGTKFGSAVAITANGIAIGDSYGDGSAYIYTLNAGLYGEGATATRTPSSTLKGSEIDPAILGFGNNIIYAGGKLLVAAYNGNFGYAGSVHMFDSSGGTFASRVSFAPAAADFTSAAQFGYAMAFDGTSLAIGAYENSKAGVGNVSGAIAYYQDVNSAAAPHVIQGSGAEERFGVSLGFAGDSLYVGSRGGTGSSGTLSRYRKSDLNNKAGYNSRIFVQRSHSQVNGESFSFAMSILNGAAVPTLFVSARSKEYAAGPGDTRSNAGGVFIYEVR